MTEQDSAASTEAAHSEIESAGESARQSDSTRTRGGAGRGLAGLALLLALMALAGSAWLLWQGMTSTPADGDQPVRELLEGLDALRENQRAIDQRLDALAGQVEEARQPDPELSRLLQTQTEQARSVERIDSTMRALDDDLRAEMQTLWQREGVQREADQELERSLLLMEAASLLRLGQERLDLTMDLAAARQAWRRAAALVQRADDPRLGEVRRLIARELESLEAIAEPDWVTLSARLARSAESVDRWPVRAAEQLGAEDSSAPADEPGWRRTMATAFGRLVRVRPRDQIVLDEDAVAVLREQIRLRYTAVELALMRRDGSALDRQLAALDQLIDLHFDTTAAELRAARSTLDELAELSMPSPPQGLGQALAALRGQIESR